ncbi:type I-B CRISPR-associated protein Cas5b [Melioribacter sp. Ez-97]|uniref:type I-B CRISPR-associated protein Cas5b n=1 Tax=Melioribacter sp. Ez-97 TaxID=3423434 RepID=UPI003EDB2241
MSNNEAKIVSIDFKASFGVLKKYDINEDIYLTYNCLHKPALLGMFGAIIGLKGYYQAFIEGRREPEYYEKFKNMKIGIQPINSSNGNFLKTVIVYNNSVGYASKETGGNLVVKEQTLISPSYRVYILLDKDEYSIKLYKYLKNVEAEFIPYLGKNDFQIFWDKPKEHKAIKFNPSSSFSISSIFIKEDIVKAHLQESFSIDFGNENKEPFFMYFERLPIGFSQITKNYELAEFVYTNAVFKPSFELSNLYEIECEDCNKQIIQVF